MLGEVEWAKLSFIVKHIEILVELIIMNELDPDLAFTMGEGAEFAILAFLYIGGIVRAKFLFVCLILVKLLNSRMRISAFITLWTFFPLADELAHVVRIKVAISFPILGVMIVDTVLMGMLLGV